MPTSTTTTQHSAYKWRLLLTQAEYAPLLEELFWQLPHLLSLTSIKNRDEQTTGFELHFTSQATELECKAHLENLLTPLNLNQTLSPTDFETILEDDWANAWKAFWKPKRILEHLVIQPSWETFTPLKNDIVLKLDPKTAFGTGEHETTELMLHAMDSYMNRRVGYDINSVLDVGTGSGILALYAAKLGVKKIHAFDNDAQAIDVAKENLAPNQLNDANILFETHTLETYQKAHPDESNWDLICANILLPVLVDLMPQLTQCLKPKGLLMMSGVLKTQFDQLKLSIDASQCFEIKNIIQKGDWIAVVCQKKKSN